VELRDGGSDDPRNLQTLCEDCHEAKTQARERAVWQLMKRHIAEYRALHERAVDDARRLRSGGRRAW
jgi:5-methylcytosine-specific restriction endonuclease McrA